MTFKNNRAPLLCYFVYHSIAICEFTLEVQSGNAQFGTTSMIFCHVWPWNLMDDLEKQKSTFSMLSASFHCHMSIRNGVMVWKCPNWGKIFLTSVTLTLDLWPRPFAWTSLLSMVITPENLMMIPWWEHSEKGLTDRRTDRQTDWTIHRAAGSQLKKKKQYIYLKNNSVTATKSPVSHRAVFLSLKTW